MAKPQSVVPIGLKLVAGHGTERPCPAVSMLPTHAR